MVGVALFVRLPFLFGEHYPAPGPDSPAYLKTADDLVHFEYHEFAFFTPGYPFFIAALQLLPGRPEDAVTIAQHLLGAGVVVAILAVAWRYFGKPAALIASGLAALTPILVAHEHAILADFLFGTVVFAGAIALAEAARRGRMAFGLLILTGVLFGIATWVKPAGQALVLAAPLAMAFATRDLRRAVRRSAVVILVMGATISPWIIRNATYLDTPVMSQQGNATLFNRAFEVDRLPIPTDQEHGRLAEDVQRRISDEPGARLTSAFKFAAMAEHDLTSDQVLTVQRRLALVAIRRHPGAYVEGTARATARSVRDINEFEGSEQLLKELDRTEPPFPRAVTDAAWDVARPLTEAWWLLSLNTLGGLLVLFIGKREQRNAAAAFLSVWLTLTLATALSHGGLWRYSIQLAPITWILASAGVVIIVSSLWQRIASERRARSA
jgi:4-amino-4-deoxy-L-arabinose transferase-like glycosyltransferase